MTAVAIQTSTKIALTPFVLAFKLLVALALFAGVSIFCSIIATLFGFLPAAIILAVILGYRTTWKTMHKKPPYAKTTALCPNCKNTYPVPYEYLTMVCTCYHCQQDVFLDLAPRGKLRKEAHHCINFLLAVSMLCYLVTYFLTPDLAAHTPYGMDYTPRSLPAAPEPQAAQPMAGTMFPPPLTGTIDPHLTPRQTFLIGVDYWNGTNVPQNTAIGMQYIQKAAAQGEPEAQYCLANYYIDSDPDHQLAAFWMLAAYQNSQQHATTFVNSLAPVQKQRMLDDARAGKIRLYGQ